MSNLYREPAIDASYQVSVHLAKRFQRRRFVKIGQSETRIDYGGHVCYVIWKPTWRIQRRLGRPTAAVSVTKCSAELTPGRGMKRPTATAWPACGVCVQYFNRLDNVARHRSQHERPEVKQRLPMKRPATPEPEPVTKQRRTVSPPTRTPMENPVKPDVFPEDPGTRVLYLRHWKSCFSELTL